MDLSEIGTSVMQMSQRHLLAVSQNIANVQTPGYQSAQSFQRVLLETTSALPDIYAASFSGDALTEMRRSIEPGELKKTDNTFDFAISGMGAFAVRDAVGDSELYTFTRNGRFTLDADGFLIDTNQHRVQNADGQDVRLSSSDISVTPEGLILASGEPVDRLGIFSQIAGPSVATALPEALDEADFEVRQGMIEASNVSLPDEMIEMMGALRQAEMGAQILRTYDTLLGQAISAFGQGR